jgi:tetratricopeptide (TPR) repeat protein
MKSAKWLYLLTLAPLAAFAVKATAAEPAKPAPAKEEQAKVDPKEEEWLNTVWTQVDDLVKQEDFKKQETVTVAGVRGAEAEDNVLDKLYYKGGKRYPSQDKLKKAIESLQQAIAQNPKAESVPKQVFFIAQCYEKLGQVEEAKTYYTQLTKDHAKSPWAPKAQERLTQLAQAK